MSDLQKAIDALRPMAGTIVDIENASVECAQDMWTLAQAYLAIDEVIAAGVLERWDETPIDMQRQIAAELSVRLSKKTEQVTALQSKVRELWIKLRRT